MDKSFWKERYGTLKLKADEFSAGKINSAEFKKTAAPLGIYEQSNGGFMVRIRVTGGHLQISDARTIIDVARKNGASYLHLTTRQDIQLHDVAAERLYSAVTGLNDAGLPVRGGGGDTYRNIVACPHSGLSQESVFDVQPYARAVDEFLREQEKSFQLPRKFKAGFSCSKADASMAVLQDLGFIAKIADGRKGFETYAGGGMGRESALGVKIFDFLPEEDMLRCVKAALEIFHEHGDRTNRAKARLRFYVQKIGAVEFKKVFDEYYGRTEKISLKVTRAFLPETINLSKTSSPVSKSFDNWKTYALSPTILGKDVFSVRIFVPDGNLPISTFEEICNIAGNNGFLRTSQGQDIVLPAVHADSLPELHGILSKLNLAGESFRGLLTCCVGAKICKIGILDSTSIASSISEDLDKLYLGRPEDRARDLIQILSSIKISGCPNACGGHPSAKIGLQGMKKSVDGKLMPHLKIFRGADLGNGKLAASSDEDIIPAENAGEFIRKTII